MSADRIVLTANRTDAVTDQVLLSPSARPAAFWIGLACALVLHAALIFGLSKSARHVGDLSGSPDAISVELVDEAELRTPEASAADKPAVAPGGAAQQPPPEAQPPSPTEEAAKQAEKTAKPAGETAKQDAAAAATLDMELPDLPAASDTAAKTSTATPATKPKSKPVAQLDLSLPSNLRGAPDADQGRSSAVSRPPGITRSGENDAFGRAVIQALRKTMPDPGHARGRVTVRILLSETGSKADVSLVQGTGDHDLDGNVLFAARQTSYPFPPNGATPADRTFLVTYVYR